MCELYQMTMKEWISVLLMIKIIINYTNVAVIVAFEVLLAWLFITKIIIKFFPHRINDKVKSLLFIIGTAMLLISGIGRLGWGIQTYGGNSPAEKLDNIIFWVLSLVGTFLLLLDFFISKYKR